MQQCLLIQIFRRQPSHITSLMHRVINECYNDFARKHWKKIAERLAISEYTAEEVFAEIRKLNPRPGAALGETMGRNTQQVTPDFIIEIDEEGNITFTLNRGKMPQLYISHDFENMIEAYRQNPQSMTRSDKEALLYAQQKVSRARSYIEAVQQRQKTRQQRKQQQRTMQRQQKRRPQKMQHSRQPQHSILLNTSTNTSSSA